MKVGIYEAKSKFSELVERAQKGEVIEITKNGKLAAKLTGASEKRDWIGMYEGQIVIHDDFDDPLEELEEYM